MRIETDKKPIARFAVILAVGLTVSMTVQMIVAPEVSLSLEGILNNIPLIVITYVATILVVSFFKGWIRFD